MCFLTVKLCRSIPVIGKVKTIIFLHDHEITYSCQITNYAERHGLFTLFDETNRQKAAVVFKDSGREQFEIMDEENHIWKYEIMKPNTLIARPSVISLRSSHGIALKVIEQGEWKIILNNGERIGRLTKEKDYPLKFSNWRITMDHPPEHAVLLIAFTLAIVIQHQVFKIYQSAD